MLFDLIDVYCNNNNINDIQVLIGTILHHYNPGDKTIGWVSIEREISGYGDICTVSMVINCKNDIIIRPIALNLFHHKILYHFDAWFTNSVESMEKIMDTTTIDIIKCVLLLGIIIGKNLVYFHA